MALPSTARFRSIDALRGVSALIVVLWHFRWCFDATPYNFILYPFYNNGQTAVDVFFVISGFVLTHVYGSRIADLKSYTDFIIRRISRLYPLHIMSLIAVSIIFIGFIYKNNVYGYIYYSNNLYNFFLNLFMLQYVGLQQGWSFNGPSWTMSAEFWINLVFGVALLMPRRSMIVGSAVICIGCTIFLVAVHGEWLSITRVGGWLEPLLLRTMAGFFAGVLTYEAWRRRPGSPIYFIGGGLGIVGLMMIPRSDPHNVVVEACIAVIASPLLVYGAASFSAIESACSRPMGVWLGDVSFSVYMWHFPIAAIFVLIGAASMPSTVLMPVYLVAVFAVATVSARAIEFPVRQRIVALLGSHQSRTVASGEI